MPNLPRWHEVSVGGRAIGFVVLAALACGILVSISPISLVLAGRASTSLRSDARRAGTERRTNTTRTLLVVGEFALALPLLLGAGLLLRSFLRLQRVDPGFDPTGAVVARVTLPTARYPDYPSAHRFWRQLEERAAGIPGVVAAGLSSELPPNETGNVNNFNLVDHPVPEGGAEPNSPWLGVTAGYFGALGVPLLEGRLFSIADSGPAPPVVVVSSAWARRYFPGEQAVGRQLISGGC